MDMKSWRTTSHHQHHRSCHHTPASLRSFSERRDHGVFVTPEAVRGGSKVQGFFISLRRRLRKEKNKVFTCAAPPPTRQDPYDPYTYSQNFEDPEARWAEPDNLTRSFSAQFAATSARMAKKGGILMA